MPVYKVPKATIKSVARIYNADQVANNEEEFREKFDLQDYKDKICDGSFHIPECKEIVVEDKGSNINYAYHQLEAITSVLVEKGEQIEECIIILKTWNRYYSLIYKTDSHGYVLKNRKKGRVYNKVNNKYKVRIIKK